MTMPKKLFFLITLGLNLCTPSVIAYDVVGLKDEVQLISEFAKQYNAVEYNGQTLYLNDWLSNKINRTWMTSNTKIIEIANLIKEKDHENLLRMAAQEKRDQKTRADFTIALLTTAAGILIIKKLSKRFDSYISSKVTDSIRSIQTLGNKINQLIGENPVGSINQ